MQKLTSKNKLQAFFQTPTLRRKTRDIVAVCTRLAGENFFTK